MVKVIRSVNGGMKVKTHNRENNMNEENKRKTNKYYWRRIRDMLRLLDSTKAGTSLSSSLDSTFGKAIAGRPVDNFACGIWDSPFSPFSPFSPTPGTRFSISELVLVLSPSRGRLHKASVDSSDWAGWLGCSTEILGIGGAGVGAVPRSSSRGLARDQWSTYFHWRFCGVWPVGTSSFVAFSISETAVS